MTINDPKVAEVLEKLADKLGTTAEYLWGVLIKQSAIEARLLTVQSVLLLLLVATLLTIAALAGRKWRKFTASNCYASDWIFAMVSFGLGGILLCIPLCITAFDAHRVWSNPEYWALRQIMQMFN